MALTDAQFEQLVRALSPSLTLTGKAVSRDFGVFDAAVFDNAVYDVGWTGALTIAAAQYGPAVRTLSPQLSLDGDATGATILSELGS